MGVLSTNMNTRLYIRKPFSHNPLRQNQRRKNSMALLLPPKSPTRLGTAQAIFLAALLALGLGSLRAQEDVAETKANTRIDTTPITEPAITDADRVHWSFAPIQRHSLPETKQSQWLRSGIDAFILAKL